MLTIVKRELTRTWTKEGKEALSNMVRTNDLTYAVRKSKDGVERKVFKISKQQFAVLGLANYALICANDDSTGKVYLLTVPNDTDGAIMKGRNTGKGETKKAQEFAYNELADLLGLGADKAGFDLKVAEIELPEGVVAAYEVIPAELVRSAKDEDETEEVEDTTLDETVEVAEEDATENWIESEEV